MYIAQLTTAVEYANFISAGWGKTPIPNDCPGYNTKPSDHGAPVQEF